MRNLAESEKLDLLRISLSLSVFCAMKYNFNPLLDNPNWMNNIVSGNIDINQITSYFEKLNIDINNLPKITKFENDNGVIRCEFIEDKSWII
jgi:hypothetical protein